MTTTGLTNYSSRASTVQKLTAWVNANGFSKYGGTGFSFSAGPTNYGGMICESCHSMQASLAGANDSLLLGTVGTVANAGTDTMCIRCHDHIRTPKDTHPVETALFSATVSRTGNTVNTESSDFAENKAYLDAHAVTEATYPVVMQMTCLSCHDIHDGESEGGAYILKIGDTNSTVGNAAANNQRANAGFLTDYTDLCATCHLNYR